MQKPDEVAAHVLEIFIHLGAGAAGAVWAPGGQPRVVFAFTITGGTVTAIEMIAGPERIGQLDVIRG